jgi:lipid-binding SYLF domain-containing protein
VGAGNITADLMVLSRAKGLYAGMSLEGSVVAVRDDLNRAYYGRPVSPAEILGGAVQNPHADPLKKSAAALAAGR